MKSPQSQYPKRKKLTRGFMLIEVLVATTLLAVGVTAALHAIFNSLRATSETRMYTQAVFLAQKVMSDLEVGAAFNDDYDVPRSGTFPEAPAFRWQAYAERTDDFWTRRIAVTVVWAGNARDLYDNTKTNYYRVVTEVPRPRYPEDYKK
jgi:Tfp pilus assembly protein PilV